MLDGFSGPRWGMNMHAIKGLCNTEFLHLRAEPHACKYCGASIKNCLDFMLAHVVKIVVTTCGC